MRLYERKRDMPDYKKIIMFFDEYLAHYRSFLKFEYAKADMINKGAIAQLSDSLTTEQALIMKTNALEARRIKLVEGCGNTFGDLIDGAPEEFKEKLKDQHEELSEIIYKIKELNDNAGVFKPDPLLLSFPAACQSECRIHSSLSSTMSACVPLCFQP